MTITELFRPQADAQAPVARETRTLTTLGVSAHLSEADIAEIGRRLDAIRAEVVADRGERDAAYIRKVIKAQRLLEVGGRAALMAGIFPPAWVAGTSMLGVAKILENMEIGHNVLHGQWDWMRDPTIHSTSWEWDTAASSAGWKMTHNYEHHTYTNVLGMDKDVGYRILRMSDEQKWSPANLGNLAYYGALALLFQYGVSFHEFEMEKLKNGEMTKAERRSSLGRILKKTAKQITKDYVLWPALAGPFFLPVLAGNLTANAARNVWSNVIIFCGHFPEGADVFTEEQLEGETRGQWYVRQMLGSCNIRGGRVMNLMSGNLSFQIEHHLFPDLPSNRYVEIAPQVEALCAEFGLPYNSDIFVRQYGSVLKKIARLSLPTRPNQGLATAPSEVATAA